MKELIAIIEDDPDILELIKINLKKENYRTKTFLNAKSFLSFIKNNTPNLILLDLMLPDIDGLEICKHLRKDEKYSKIPIIILTAKDSELDKIIGLELGADDYMTKPFSTRELIARVKAVLRRSSVNQKKSKKIKIDKILEIDLERYNVKISGKTINLTTTEFKILKILASNKGIVFSRQDILDDLWGTEKAVIDRTIDVHIRHLREKLGKASKYIKNIRGIGYKVSDE